MFPFKILEELFELCVELDPEKLSMRKTNVLALIPSFHRTFNIHVIVLDNTQDYVTSTDTFGALSS